MKGLKSEAHRNILHGNSVSVALRLQRRIFGKDVHEWKIRFPPED